MTDESALLAAIRAAPADDAPRLVYADWLDEHGRPEQAEFIRVQCDLARLDDAQWEQASLCEGWSVHDVAAPGFPPAVIGMCERALAEPGVAGDPVLRARLLAQMASSHADASRLGVSSDLSATALRLAEENDRLVAREAARLDVAAALPQMQPA